MAEKMMINDISYFEVLCHLEILAKRGGGKCKNCRYLSDMQRQYPFCPVIMKKQTMIAVAEFCYCQPGSPDITSEEQKSGNIAAQLFVSISYADAGICNQ